MKKNFLIVILVAALSLISCGKETSIGTDIKWGEVKIGDYVYTPSLSCIERYYLPQRSSDHCSLNIYPDKSGGNQCTLSLGGTLLNKTVNLADPSKSGVDDVSFHLNYMPAGRNGDDYYMSYVKGGDCYYRRNGSTSTGSAFKSGTLKVTYDSASDYFTYELDGVLVDGTPVGLMIKGECNSK